MSDDEELFPAAIEELQDTIHEWGELCFVIIWVVPCIADAQAFSGTWQGYIEFACILHALLLGPFHHFGSVAVGGFQNIVDHVERVGPVVGFQYNHIVKFKPFALMDGHDKYSVCYQSGSIDKVALVDAGCHVRGQTPYLLAKGLDACGSEPFILGVFEKYVELSAQVACLVLLSEAVIKQQNEMVSKMLSLGINPDIINKIVNVSTEKIKEMKSSIQIM